MSLQNMVENHTSSQLHGRTLNSRSYLILCKGNEKPRRSSLYISGVCVCAWEDWRRTAWDLNPIPAFVNYSHCPRFLKQQEVGKLKLPINLKDEGCKMHP